MLDAAREAIQFAASRTHADLDADQMLLHSLIRCLEIIGEAASRVSAGTRQETPAIPWPLIIAMRNRLVHAYHDVNHDIVWATSGGDLPPLIKALEAALLNGEPEGTG
ncbi:MAG: DUF86 domain-containing protein [Chloroflexi bacterium]|nr:DUF86 domain-containing protein [Chloroflexota bacterium]